MIKVDAAGNIEDFDAPKFAALFPDVISQQFGSP